MIMTTNEIRAKFLNFFKSKGHSIIASDSLVPKDDPTVLFTTAGMQQFKPQFLGHIDGFTRAATCQKCLRTDDLDVVGKTDFHHTFFEMLGNFSFGDYFKKDAIHWAWEFLTGELKLPKEKLWVSVYQEDAEAYGIWADEIKIPKERIIKLGDKSNFWPSNAKLNGPNGPCGPCSEIFYEYPLNPECPNGKDCNPDCSCGRFSEVWNLVFTQFNRKDGGVLEPLPTKNIDTGMGLERLAAVVQSKKSNYETDNFALILKEIKLRIKDISEFDARIIADHMRAVVFGIADGVIPSNEGRGYVMRKLIVDMVSLVSFPNASVGNPGHAISGPPTKTFGGGNLRRSPVIHAFVRPVIDAMKQPYPDLLKYEKDIVETIKHIEVSVIKLNEEKVPLFVKELDKLRKKYVIDDEIDSFKYESRNVTAKSSGVINAKLISDLGGLMFFYRDTYGLPMNLIQSKVKERFSDKAFEAAFSKALELFEDLMEEQKNRSRASSKMAGDVFANQDFALNLPKTEFLGYKELKAEAKVLKILNDQGETNQAHQGQSVKIILNRTPFYAEAGGQVGDTGYLIGDDKTLKVRVTDTQKANDIYVHSGMIESGAMKTGDKVQAVIDEPRRRAIMRNHTATHLLQAALREILGAHIKQQGSLVEEGRFRFDFTHPKGISPEEMKKIENRVDEFIRRADPVTTEILALEEARKKGALAFFAEKYGEVVRVLSIGDYSREFCGGTHVSSTRDIEAMKITSEGSVAQGIRRVEAVTGKKDVEKFLNKKQQELAIMELGERKKQQEKEDQNVYFEKIKSSVDEMIKAGENVKGVNLIIRSLENIDIASLRKLSDLLKQKVKSGIFILGAKDPENASMVLSVTDDLVARGIKANELMDQITPLMDGSGGGRPQLAQAGSKQPQKLDEALVKARDIVKDIIGT
jgi:alanyl-tRNA synthetase